jgi:hypothetical protein
MLPGDLKAAESQALEALQAALAAEAAGRWTVEWRFEGLRLLPPALRLCQALQQTGHAVRLLFPDAGAGALARRDAPELAGCIGDFRSELRRQAEAKGGDAAGAASEGPVELLLAVAPGQPDYDDFAQLCAAHRGPVVLLNGTLEDAAVGIGSVARERRRGFLAQWQAAYQLQPLEGSALRRSFPGDWELYRQDPDGFRLAARFDQKPDSEAQLQALAGGEGLGVGGNLKVLDAFIEGLRS